MGVADAIGGFLGGVAKGVTGTVIEKVTGIVDKLVPDKDLATKLNAEFRMQELVTEADLEKAHLSAETQVQVAQEATHQAELNQTDIYTKQTRPKIARQSWYVSGLYAMVCFSSDFLIRMVQTFSHPTDPAATEWLHSLQGIQFQWEVYVAAAAPALTYMGVRSFDVWRAGGAGSKRGL